MHSPAFELTALCMRASYVCVCVCVCVCVFATHTSVCVCVCVCVSVHTCVSPPSTALNTPVLTR